MQTFFHMLKKSALRIFIVTFKNRVGLQGGDTVFNFIEDDMIHRKIPN